MVDVELLIFSYSYADYELPAAWTDKWIHSLRKLYIWVTITPLSIVLIELPSTYRIPLLNNGLAPNRPWVAQSGKTNGLGAKARVFFVSLYN